MKKVGSITLATLNQIVDIALRILAFIRPKFFNKITWAVVTVGLALMSTGLLERIATALLSEAFSINITGENDTAWGFALVVLGLVYHIASNSFYEFAEKEQRKEKSKKQAAHDIAIFKAANEIMTGDFLSNFLHWLDTNHAYNMEDIRKLEEFCRFLAKDENQFINKEILNSVQEFLKKSMVFLEFSAYKFFIYPDHQTGDNPMLCMQPALNMDKGGDGTSEQMKKYDELTTELESVVDELREGYRRMRAAVKVELII